MSAAIELEADAVHERRVAGQRRELARLIVSATTAEDAHAEVYRCRQMRRSAHALARLTHERADLDAAHCALLLVLLANSRAHGTPLRRDFWPELELSALLPLRVLSTSASPPCAVTRAYRELVDELDALDVDAELVAAYAPVEFEVQR